MPRRRRKPAETDVPMIPPISEKELNLFDIEVAVAATTMDVVTTILDRDFRIFDLKLVSTEE